MERVEVQTEGLRKNAIGTLGIVFFVLAFAAPLAAIMGVGHLALGSTGSPGAPAAFALTTVLLLIFSVGFTAMSRERSGPGGFAVYIGEAFGPRGARAASFVAVLGYNGFLIGNLALLASTASDIVSSTFGVAVPWWGYAAVALVIIAALGYGEVDLSVKVLGILLILEIAVILILDVSVVARGGAAGLNLTGFTPMAMSQGAVGIVFLLAFGCFVGFEATTLFGDEARDRHRTIPRATYIAVISIGVFYTLVIWVFQVGWGAATRTQADTNPGAFIFDLNTRFVGTWSTQIMVVLVLTSIFAAVLSLHSALSRYMFAMGGSGMLPRFLAHSHPRWKSPDKASLTQTCVSGILLLVVAALGADPITMVYTWAAGTGAVAILCLYIGASVAVSRALRRSRSETRIWVTTIAPIIAAVLMTAVLVLAVTNFSFLTGSTDALVNSLWVLPFLVAAIGVVLPVSSVVRNRSMEAAA